MEKLSAKRDVSVFVICEQNVFDTPKEAQAICVVNFLYSLN